MISRYEQFSFVISSIYRHIQKIEREEMIKFGYKGAFAQYLAVLNRYADGVTSSEMCEICDKDKAAVSRIIAEMEANGLVERIAKEGSKYRAKIVLTKRGKGVSEFVLDRVNSAVAAVALTDAERPRFYAALEELESRLEHISHVGIPENEYKGELI